MKHYPRGRFVWPRWPWIVGAALLVVLIATISLTRPIRLSSRQGSVTEETIGAGSASSESITAASTDLTQDLLDQIKRGDAAAGAASPSGTLDNAHLVRKDAELDELQRQIQELKDDAAAAAKEGDSETTTQKLRAAKESISLMEASLQAFQTELRHARTVRQDDPLLQWLTGKLLMRVGGGPEEILPFFAKAVDGGLERSDVMTSLARIQFELQQFASAHDTALKAVTLHGADRSAWEVFEGAAMGLERFDELIAQVDRAFPDGQPTWAADIRERARRLSNDWKVESARRATERAANTLPRVRLMIEHMEFQRDRDDHVSPTPRVTGRDEVMVELFEDQAPATVANFLTLVESGFYDGTRFHWIEPANIVVGGDPNTKNDDPEDDGAGNPGYAIPDEFAVPGARPHFRGTLAMVVTGPGTAGSQFLINVVPHPTFQGRFTAFGRVIAGQDAIDRMTPGRTNYRVGRYGKLIPGDRIVRAEVVRKRAHRYDVVKQP